MFTHADMRASHSATRRFAHFRTSASVCSSITPPSPALRSEEHTSELQSQSNLVCRLLLEKKKHRCHRRPTHAPSRRPPRPPCTRHLPSPAHHLAPLPDYPLARSAISPAPLRPVPLVHNAA